ncbi:MAG: non-canonical purine NTP pyrophosphatase, partial [Pseudomonadota bacterium]
MKIALASGNAGKLAEFERLLAPLGAEVVSQSELSIDGAVEDGETFVENALKKARHVAAHSKLPTIADDSGIVVPALNGAPGI